MSTHLSPSEDLKHLEDLVAKAMKGERDPEAMKKATESMDRIREEIHRKHGVLDIGVPAIRELRDA